MATGQGFTGDQETVAYRLVEAAGCGEIKTVRDLLRKHPSKVDSVWDGNITPLMMASYVGRTDVVQLLLEAGASIDKKNDRGESVLHWAVDGGKVDVVKTLLQRGAQINSVDENGDTPLFYAIRYSNTEVVELLINHPDIDLSIKNKEGRNVLHVASERWNVDVVKTLLQRGAQINSMDENGETPLFYAINEKNTGLIELLINHPEIDLSVKNKHGQNLLYYASGRGNVDVVKTLLQRGAQINSVDKYGDTPLVHAIWCWNTTVIEVLINHPEIDLSIKSKKGVSLLHCATGYPWWEDEEKPKIKRIVEKLLQAGLDINSVDEDGNTPLYHAIDNKNTDAVELLINHPEIDLSIKNKEGVSLLHCATGCLCWIDEEKPKLKRIVEKLLQAGLDINSVDKDGDTPIHIVVNKGETELTELLIDQPNIDLSLCNDKGFTVLSFAVLRNDLITTELLIDKHPSIINTKDGNGLTALHLAAHNGHDQIVSFLIEKGADLKLGNDSQQTPLMMAVKACQLSTVKLLVENGADLNVSDEDGDSCLHFAVRKYSASTQTDSDQALTWAGFTIACFLLRNGADVNIRNKEGMTAIDLIQDTEKRKNFEMLV